MRAVGGERPPVDLQDQRHPLPLEIAGRQRQPSLDIQPVMAGGGGDLANRSQRLDGPQGAIEIGQCACLATARVLDLSRASG